MKDRQLIQLPVVHLTNNQAAICEAGQCNRLTRDYSDAPYCLEAAEPDTMLRRGIPENCPNGFQNQPQS